MVANPSQVVQRAANSSRREHCKTLVIVPKLDRLYRSVVDAANVIADFGQKGILPAAKAKSRGGNEILCHKS